MNSRKFVLLLFGATAGIAVLLSGCTPRSSAHSTQASPEEVVERFYAWYLGYEGNPLVDKAYQSSAYLTEDFVRRVDELIASFDKGGYDPFLCAQDKPGDLVVGEATVSDERATVVVHEVWNPGTAHKLIRNLEIILREVDGQWKINGVVPEPEVLTPEAVVKAFYDWYLAYEGNPLADKAYQSSEYLTEDLMRRVDERLDSQVRGGYDPFLCAQDKPSDLVVGEATVSDERAAVTVHEVWNPGTAHELIRDPEVILQKVDGQWKIASISCPRNAR